MEHAAGHFQDGRQSNVGGECATARTRAKAGLRDVFREPPSSAFAHRRRPPRLKRMEISNLLSETSVSDDGRPPSPTAAATADLADTHSGHGTSTEEQSYRQHGLRLRRGASARTPHSLSCAQVGRGAPEDSHHAGLLSHHSCIPCRRLRKWCIPRKGQAGCVRCHRNDVRCEIVDDGLLRYRSFGAADLQPRIVSVRALDGGPSQHRVRLVPVCQCPLLIAE